MTTNTSCPLESLNNGRLPEGFCAFELPVTLSNPRSILAIGDDAAAANKVLVLERGTMSVILVEDTDNDGIVDTKRSLVSAPRLNHGLAVYDGYIYASSDTIVYRWSFTDETFTEIGPEEIVINNINADGNGGAPLGHTTRTLAFDSMGTLYVSVGSDQNVDPDSFRSRIRRFPNLSPSDFPIDFLTGEVFADGLRNEVGLAFDKFGVLWGVENGADNLRRGDIGGDITNDNPAEELNRFPEEMAGSHFGYPYCWTEYLLPEEYAMGRGTVWAWPDFLNDGTVTDEDCRNNYVGAEVSMQAHSAPLGITFYEWKEPDERPAACANAAGAFPRDMDGYAFIGFHGSWNRDIPTGYKVVYVAMDENGRAVGEEPVDLLAHAGAGARWDDGFRPVDVDFDACGRLLVSSDGSRGVGGSKLVRIEYHGESKTNDDNNSTATAFPTKSPTLQGTVVPTTIAPSAISATPTTGSQIMSHAPTSTPTPLLSEGLTSTPTPPPASSAFSITTVSDMVTVNRDHNCSCDYF